MLTKYLGHQNGQLAYDDSGSGPLIICVPSMGDIRAQYRFLRPLLLDAGLRVVTMDVRGHGETSTDWEDFSVAGVGADMLALIRADAGPAILVGSSMAGGAAIWAGAEAPDLVRGLILLDPFVDGDGDRFLQLVFTVMFARPWGPSMWLKYYASLYPTSKPADFAEYSAALHANLKERGRLEALMQMLYASKKASEERLPIVDKPALVLMGSKDPDFKNSEGQARRVAGALHAAYEMIAGAGHYPQAEMPEVVASHMRAFIDSLKEG